MTHVNNAATWWAAWKPGESFKPETEFRLWDEGHNFYAPQSFNTEGRQIMYGWMSPFVAPIPMEEDGWCGNLTLPREITLGDDGDLVTAPTIEMEGLRENTIGFDSLDLGTNQTSTILDDDGGALEIEMRLDLNKTTAERAGLHVHATSDGHYTAIVFDAQIGGVVIDRQNVANGDKGYRVAKLSDTELAADTLGLARVHRPRMRRGLRRRRQACDELVLVPWRWRTRRRTRERIRHHAHRHPHHALAQVHRTRVNKRSTVPAAGHRASACAPPLFFVSACPQGGLYCCSRHAHAWQS